MVAEGIEIRKHLVIEALKKSLGVVTPACEQANIARSTYYEWLEKDPQFKKQVEDIKEIAIDFVESKMFKKIQRDEDPGLIKYYLGTQGKNRGYYERQEIKSDDLKKVTVEILHAPQDKSD